MIILISHLLIVHFQDGDVLLQLIDLDEMFSISGLLLLEVQSQLINQLVQVLILLLCLDTLGLLFLLYPFELVDLLLEFADKALEVCDF